MIKGEALNCKGNWALICSGSGAMAQNHLVCRYSFHVIRLSVDRLLQDLWLKTQVSTCVWEMGCCDGSDPIGWGERRGKAWGYQEPGPLGASTSQSHFLYFIFFLPLIPVNLIFPLQPLVLFMAVWLRFSNLRRVCWECCTWVCFLPPVSKPE